MEVMNNHGSIAPNPLEPIPTKRATIDALDSNQSFQCYGTKTDETSNERPSKKAKVEVNNVVVEYALPVGFLDSINHERIAFETQSSMEIDTTTTNNNDNQKTVVVPSLLKQFWKAGDYERPANNNESSSHQDGMDHLRVHPRFLHSNATSHKWALGAFAELLDNSLDEVRTGATYVNVDVLSNGKDTGSKMLLVEDNGGGMTPDKMRGCMSLGYSVKSKLANTIGQYGNGFKTSTMRLGADVLVFTRCPGQDGKSPTQSVGMLSYTFLMETGKEDIVVPMVDFEKRGDDWGMLVRSSADDWKRNMETLVQWTPYSSEQALVKQFDFLKDQGTRIIIYNLWEDEEGKLELDFDTDSDDIQIRGVNRDPRKIEMAKEYPNSRHFLTYRHSLRSYAAILYLNLPHGFRIILRGQDVIHHNIINDMMHEDRVMYKPMQPTADGSGPRNDQTMMAVVTIGFVKDAKHHIDVQGFNVYHKNRLIKPFWRVWNAAGSDGRGVIGVLEADFVEPAHDKQGFERTTVLQRLENRLITMQKKYWTHNCQRIGYAPRCKSVPDSKTKPSLNDKSSDEDNVDTNDAKTKLRPVRKPEATKPVVYAQEAEIPEAYTCTPRKSQFKALPSSKTSSSVKAPPSFKASPLYKASPSLKESKASTSCLPSEVNLAETTNGDIIVELRKENLELKQRLGCDESSMINDLLHDLRAERDKTTLLENKVQKAEEKIKELDKEQEAIIDVFSEERQRRDVKEETLMKKLKEAMTTVEELRREIKMLEDKRVAN